MRSTRFLQPKPSTFRRAHTQVYLMRLVTTAASRGPEEPTPTNTSGTPFQRAVLTLLGCRIVPTHFSRLSPTISSPILGASKKENVCLIVETLLLYNQQSSSHDSKTEKLDRMARHAGKEIAPSPDLQIFISRPREHSVLARMGLVNPSCC